MYPRMTMSNTGGQRFCITIIRISGFVWTHWKVEAGERGLCGVGTTMRITCPSMVSKLKSVFFPIKEKVASLGPKGETFSCVKNRSYFIKEELSFGPFQNLEVTSDSLACSSTLQKGPVTAWHFRKEHLKSSALEVIQKYTKEIGSVFFFKNYLPP